jgi:PAS domain S-box-containing protein
MGKSKKLFIYLSITIALLDLLFVLTNYHYTKKALNDTILNKSQTFYTAFNTQLEATYNQMLMQATLFASFPNIQQLFLQGKKALDSGELNKADQYRNQLNEFLQPVWKKIKQNFDVKQLHFHLGPGSLSYLRVHQPEKYGDRMDDIRFIIVDSNAEQKSYTGFETGRISSGLRGTMPVFAWDEDVGKEVYVGVLESGTSFKNMLSTLDKNFDISVSILLNIEHIRNTTWEEFIANKLDSGISECKCVLENSSRPGIKEIIEQSTPHAQTIQADGLPRITKFNDRSFFITYYPLRDYRGTKDPTKPNIGAVMIRKDISDTMDAYYTEQKFNIYYALIVFLIVEGLLYLTFRTIIKHLKEKVKQQTAKLTEQKKLLEEDKIKYQNLAESINQGYFMYTYDKNESFIYVSPSVTDILGYSEDEFLTNKYTYLTKKADILEVNKKTKQVLRGEKLESYEIEIFNKKGRLRYLLVTETPIFNDKLVKVDGIAQDITHLRQNRLLLKLRGQVFEMLYKACAVNEIFESLILAVEDITKDMRCSILLLDNKTSQLHLGAAPNLPYFYNEAIDGLKIGPHMGSCGAAAYTAKRMIVEDIYNHPNWHDYLDLIKQTSFRACWSEPIMSSDAKVLGTFAMYYDEPIQPDDFDLHLIASIADMVAITIETSHSSTALKETEQQMKHLLRNCQEGVFGLDLQGNTTFINPAASRMLGYTAEELEHNKNHNLIHHSHANGHRIDYADCKMSAAYFEEKDMHVKNEVLWRKNGSSFPIEYWSTPIRRNEETIGAIVVFQDITGNKTKTHHKK